MFESFDDPSLYPETRHNIHLVPRRAGPETSTHTFFLFLFKATWLLMSFSFSLFISVSSPRVRLLCSALPLVPCPSWTHHTMQPEPFSRQDPADSYLTDSVCIPALNFQEKESESHDTLWVVSPVVFLPYPISFGHRQSGHRILDR